MKLCQSSGYDRGTWVSDSGNMCTTGVGSGTYWYYVVDTGSYASGSYAMETCITAQCESGMCRCWRA